MLRYVVKSLLLYVYLNKICKISSDTCFQCIQNPLLEGTLFVAGIRLKEHLAKDGGYRNDHNPALKKWHHNPKGV